MFRSDWDARRHDFGAEGFSISGGLGSNGDAWTGLCIGRWDRLPDRVEGRRRSVVGVMRGLLGRRG